MSFAFDHAYEISHIQADIVLHSFSVHDFFLRVRRDQSVAFDIETGQNQSQNSTRQFPNSTHRMPELPVSAAFISSSDSEGLWGVNSFLFTLSFLNANMFEIDDNFQKRGKSFS